MGIFDRKENKEVTDTGISFKDNLKVNNTQEMARKIGDMINESGDNINLPKLIDDENFKANLSDINDVKRILNLVETISFQQEGTYNYPKTPSKGSTLYMIRGIKSALQIRNLIETRK